MEGRNIAFDTPEPADGSVFVVYISNLGEDPLPYTLMRDDKQADRYRHMEITKDARWFRSDDYYTPMTWGEALAYATALHKIEPQPWKTRRIESR